MGKIYTIHDIAIRLNISRSTVSRALRDHPDVSKKTKKLVKEMAEELNYQKNILASNLASKSSNLIGVVVPEIARQHFFAQALSGIQQVAREKGFIVMICQSDETLAEEIVQIQALINSRVAGILISLSKETNSYAHIEQAVNRNIPVVLFDRGAEGLKVSQILADDYQGAYDITQHLLDQGFQNLAHLSGPMSLSISQKRYEGFMDALRDAKLNVAEAPVYQCDNLSLDAEQAVDRLLSMKQRPDAIFCMSDYIAIQVMQVLKKRGYKIPEDIAIAGFAGDPITELIEPNISTVEQPSFEMGVIAARRLMEEIACDESETMQNLHRVLGTKTLIRASTKR